MKFSDASLAIVAVIFSALVGGISAAHAQDASIQGIEEIVITAQRRPEPLQAVPITVQTFNAATLENIGVKSTEDFALAIPGFYTSPVAGGNAYFLRGVGIGSTSPGVEAEVSTYVDGVYLAFQDGNHFGFNNVSSIEVDKGPQGTLFGRNATGGVIQINTKDPQQTPSSDVEVSYGNYNNFIGSFYGTTGITPRLAADIALYGESQGKGWGTNFATGEGTYRPQYFGARTKWVFQASDSTSIRFIADYGTSANTAGEIRPPNGTEFNEITGQVVAIPGGIYDFNENLKPFYKTDQFGASLKVQSDFGWANGVSITSWRGVRSYFQVDGDGTPIDFLDVALWEPQTAETQEFQLLSADSSKLKWVAGAFFLNERGFNQPFALYGPLAQIAFGASPGGIFGIFAKQTTRSYAGYGQATLAILPSTNLTLGARYTIDQQTLSGYTEAANTITPGSAGNQSAKYSKPTFRVSLDHNFTTAILGYASFNRGFHSGTFNINSIGGLSAHDDPPVNPEVIDAYEVGVKSEWFDRRLRVNVAGFLYHYSNLQLQQYVDGAPVTTNAAAARIKGVDIDMSARPVANLTLGLNAEILDAKFTSYPGAPFYSVGADGSQVASPGDASGKRMPSAPPASLNAYATYDISTPVGTFSTTASVNYTDGWYADPGNDVRQPTYWLVNLNEKWTINPKVDIRVWGKNLAGTRYFSDIGADPPVGYTTYPGAPRTYGVTLGVHF